MKGKQEVHVRPDSSSATPTDARVLIDVDSCETLVFARSALERAYPCYTAEVDRVIAKRIGD